MGAVGTKMKIGSRVTHPKLGDGIILRFCKYGGVLVDYSDHRGIMVRVSHVSTLVVIDE